MRSVTLRFLVTSLADLLEVPRVVVDYQAGSTIDADPSPIGGAARRLGPFVSEAVRRTPEDQVRACLGDPSAYKRKCARRLYP